MPTITRAIKNNSARLANRILNRQGQPFWQNESFDRWIRTPAARDRAADYIENNPVSAGFVTRADQWPWSHCRTMHSSTSTGG
jgi:hypothetical protein